MRTAASSSIIATQRWNEFKSKVLIHKNPKLESKIENDWGKFLGFISNSFYR
jgi:hypothetical protein